MRVRLFFDIEFVIFELNIKEDSMRIKQNDSVLLIIDIEQNNTECEQILEKSKVLIKGCDMLKVPVVYEEYNSQILGHTITNIRSIVPDAPVLERHTLSCFDDEAFRKWLEGTGKKNVIICGVESHIRVLQTAIDLKDAGYTPVVVWDAVTGIIELNKKLALKRLIQEGVIPASTESILFELMATCPKECNIGKDFLELIQNLH